jgi:RNA polymerase sigma-70 factor (ECF subfamily)
MGLPVVNADDLNRARLGDPASFECIVRTYQNWVHRLAYRMVWDAHEARDLAQEVFLRLYRSFDRYDPDRPFGPWFFRLATNVCLNALKKKRNAPASFQALRGSGELEFDPPFDGPGTVETAGILDEADRVREAVLDLPPTYRTAVSLRYLKGMSYEEMAEVLDLPLGTVKNRLFRAREKLKRVLAPEGADVAEEGLHP